MNKLTLFNVPAVTGIGFVIITVELQLSGPQLSGFLHYLGLLL